MLRCWRDTTPGSDALAYPMQNIANIGHLVLNIKEGK